MTAAQDGESAQQSSLRHYATMLEIAEQGLQAALAGNLDELEPLSRRWEELVAIMPARPPAAAEPLLRRASLLSEAAGAQLRRLHETLMADISFTARAGRAAQGYAAQGYAAQGYAAQGAPRVRVDRCA